MVKLRETFNVKQKIDFLGDKIRINFLNWLDLISLKIKNITYFDGDLVLVIEGASLMLEQDSQQENSMKFWIPRSLPDRVRLIISLDEDSYNIDYFRSLGCEFLELGRNDTTLNMTMDHYSKKDFIMEEEYVQKMFRILKENVKNNKEVDNLYVKVLLSCFLPHKNTGLFDGNKKIFRKISDILSDGKNLKTIETSLKAAKNTEELILFVLDFYKDKIVKPEIFFDLVALLIINYKGLYFDEIQSITGISELQLSVVCLLLKSFFIQHKNYWKITNPLFIKLFNKKYLKDKSKKRLLHLKISKALDPKEDSIRKLEEQTNNLFHSEDFFSLKQKISSIDNFIILFNETTKIELFKFWQKLEKKGYDPVYEYNKALELFEMHYNPKDSELFILNIQICRFFKELSEFESNITPEFRHPYIQSKIVQDVGTIEYQVGEKTINEKPAVEERVAPGDYFKTCEDGMSFGIGSNLNSYYKDYPKIFKNNEEEEYFLLQRKSTEFEAEDKPINYLAEIGILEELESLKLYGVNNKILKEHEALNIEIPLNRKKFVNYFEEKINEKEKFKVKGKKTTSDLYEFEIEDANEEIVASNEMLMLQEKHAMVDEYTKMIQNIDLTIEKSLPKMFYYYKRWIWMNFPLICLSKEKTTFSDLISYCYSENRISLNFEQDRSIYFNCLLIINNLKESKKSVLKKKSNATNFSVTHKSVARMSKKNDSVLNLKTKPKQNSIISRKSLNNSKSVKSIYFNSDKKMVERLSVSKRGSLLPKSTFGQRRETQIKVALELSTKQKKNSAADLNKILKKSMQFEQSLMKSNFIDMKKQVFNQKNGKKNPSIYNNKINNLSQLLEKWGSKELMLVTKKKDAIMNDYNKLVYQKTNLLEKIDKLENIKKQKQIDTDKQGKQSKTKNKDVFNVIYFQTKKKEMETNLQNVKNQKERYEAIIDICILNKIQNEDWIRNLTFYYNNLKAILAEKQSELDKKSNQLIDIKFKSRVIYEKYQFNKEKKDVFITNFVKYLNQKKEIDRAILHGRLKSRFKN